MGESPYKLVGRLPPRVSFASRYKALHKLLTRSVEFRFERQAKDPARAARFHQELDELARVDHPCFLPLLDRGALRGRQGYVVPFREHQTVPQLVASRGFSLPRAAACVRSLATGLAAAHAAGFYLGAISPKQVAWNETANGAYFLHHRTGAPAYMRDPKLALPHDVWPSSPLTERGDVFHWGFFAYFLLTRGKVPYRGGEDALDPIREHCPKISPTLAMVVEAALSRAPNDRPEAGAALVKVLQTDGFVPVAPGPQAAAAGASEEGASEEGASEEPMAPEDVDVGEAASVAFQAVVADLGDRPAVGEDWLADAAEDVEEDSPEAAQGRASRGIPLEAVSLEEPAPESDSESGAEAELEPDADQQSEPEQGSEPKPEPKTEPQPAPEEEEEEPDLGQFESSAIPAMGRGGRRISGERPELPGSVVAVVVGLALLALILAFSGGGEGVEEFYEPPSEEPGIASDGSLIPLAPEAARPFTVNPHVRELLLLKEVTPKSFPRVMQRLNAMVLEKRLPRNLRDPVRLQDIRTLHSKYPKQGAKELGRFLDDMRRVLGEPARRR